MPRPARASSQFARVILYLGRAVMIALRRVGKDNGKRQNFDRISFLDCRDRRHRRPNVATVIASHPSALFIDRRGRRPRRPEKDNGNRRTLFKRVILSGVSRYRLDREYMARPTRSRTFFDGVVKKGEGVACPRTEGSTKRLYLTPFRIKSNF